MTTGAPDLASVVRALSDASVQFVVVGEPVAGQPVRLVVSRHPTNLDALGRALDRLDAVMRRQERSPAGEPGEPGEPEEAEEGKEAEAEEAGEQGGPRRAVDPMGTIAVRTSAGDVDLVFGGATRSLYAEAADRAEEREVEGLRVRWIGEVPAVEPAPRATSRMVGRRLLSLAEELAHLMEHRDGGSKPSTPLPERETPPG